MNVALLGASAKTDRYAYKAFKLLVSHGHKVFLINPQLADVEGEPVYPSLAALSKPIDTLTVYVGSQKLPALLNEMLAAKPKRVIFNPGTEEPKVIATLKAAGIDVWEACTLVLLRTQQF